MKPTPERIWIAGCGSRVPEDHRVSTDVEYVRADVAAEGVARLEGGIDEEYLYVSDAFRDGWTQAFRYIRDHLSGPREERSK